MSSKRVLASLVLAATLLLSAACGDAGSAAPDAPDDASDTLRLGYFPNVTHGTAIVGVEKGFFADELGKTKLETKTFNAGPDAVTALFGNSIDATYIGPNPALNAFQKSNGEAIRIIAGASSGGAFLVVKPEIESADDLEGKTIASPQLGNTQDVALRAWLEDEGFETTAQGGGDVKVLPQDNALSLETFRAGKIDGAWVPEPWATRLVQEGGGKVLVDERDLWPDGKYVTVHLIVRTKYLEDHPDKVKALLAGHIAADEYINENSDDTKKLVNSGIEKATTKAIADEVLDAAWPNLTFTVDPVASSLEKSKDDAVALGLLEEIELDGIYDLDLLNELLEAAGRDPVEGL